MCRFVQEWYRQSDRAGCNKVQYCAQAALMERSTIGHPDQQTAGNFRCHLLGILLWIWRLVKEGICFNRHCRLLSVTESYTRLRFQNRISVHVLFLIVFLVRYDPPSKGPAVLDCLFRFHAPICDPKRGRYNTARLPNLRYASYHKKGRHRVVCGRPT